jgi:DNA-binding response OmpR family regulator
MPSKDSQRATVLVVEDEAHIRDLVCLHLRLEHFDCVEAADGKTGLQLAREFRFDLIILDLMLPGIDGVTVCRALRRDSVHPDVPILMLTARRGESNKVLGLESGADDYLTKPFGIRELIARTRALLRRQLAKAPPDNASLTIVHSNIKIDPAKHRVQISECDVDLTTHEFQLLYVLLSNPGIVFSREALIVRVWKERTHVTLRSVDTLVKRLRKKIEENPADPKIVLTVWGTGYKAPDV